MRSVIQRVDQASVSVDGTTVGHIDQGLCLFIGITHGDTEEDIKYVVDKTLNMRVFPEKSGMSGFDQSVQEVNGGLLLISQFTLYASTRKGRRPSFIDAAHKDLAQSIFDKTVQAFHLSGLQIQTGIFGASMNVKIDNAGPFTILLDSQDRDISLRRQA